jgi:hypothetical protein
MPLQPYQQRVVEEKSELEERLAALHRFIDGDVYSKLDEAERGRLRQQRYFMNGYAQVLRERIDAFSE